MSSIHNPADVKVLFLNEQEEDVDMELEELSRGDKIEFEETVVPDNWVLTVVEVNSEIEYDSYGYGSSNGFIVISVSDGTAEVLYKLSGGYSSYEGWSWYFDSMAPTEKKEKVVTTWEWV